MALITDLPAATTVASTDVFLKDTGSATQKITAANLAAGLGVNPPNNSTVLYSNTSGISIGSGATIALDDDYTNYKYLVLTLYHTSVTATNRGAVMIPCSQLSAATYYTCQAGVVSGYMRMQKSGDAGLNILSAVLSTGVAVYLTSVVGVK